MSIKHVDKAPVSVLFRTDSRAIFEIPKYQREYTWGLKDWESLFDDLADNDLGYFLGTIIFINNTDDALGSPKLQVVDGQQRLTTLSLLLASIYSSIAAHKASFTDDQLLAYMQLKKELVLNKELCETRIIPQTQNFNFDDYRAVLAEQCLIKKHPMPARAGLRRIKKAFEYFRKRLNDLTSENGDLAPIFAMLTKVNAAQIVTIEVSTHADAYTLFESLNNRGTPLTAVDLIKNLLLAQLDKAGKANIDYYFSQWQQVLKYLGDDYAIQERFFRQYYNAFRRNINTLCKQPDDSRPYPLGILATRSNLMDIYEKIIKRDPVAFMDEITESAAIYAKLILSLSDDEDVKPVIGYQTLSNVQGAPSYLFLMYLEKKRSELQLTDACIAKVTALLVKFFIRRNLTDTPPTHDVTRMFMSMIEEIEEQSLVGDKIYQATSSRIISVSVSDSVFEERLRGQIYNENYDATRFILCELARKDMTIETEIDLWRRTGNKVYTWTIEHIFPQGDTIPDSWVDMIADGDVAKAKEHQADYVHTLGNLTLTGFNSKLSNHPFLEKRDKKDKDGRNNGYHNGLRLNIDVANQDSWTVEKIKVRTERLVKEAMTLFALEDSR